MRIFCIVIGILKYYLRVQHFDMKNHEG